MAMTLPLQGLVTAEPQFLAQLTDGTGAKMVTNLLTVVQGSDRTFQLLVTDPAGNPQNLTGYVVYFTVKDKLAAGTVLIAKVSTNSAQILILDQTVTANLGLAQILLVPADSSSHPVGQYFYDIWLKTPTGKKYNLFPPSTFEIKNTLTVPT